MELIVIVSVLYDQRASWHNALFQDFRVSCYAYTYVSVSNGPHDQLYMPICDTSIMPLTGKLLCVPFSADRGFGEACNIGASLEVNAKFILFANPDAHITVATIEHMANILGHTARLGIVSAQLVDKSQRLAESGGRFPSTCGLVSGKLASLGWHRREQVTSTSPRDHHHGVEMVDWVSGAVMMIRREAWDAVGGFDPAFFLYYEDIDLCRRVRAAGWEVGIVPDATAIHESGGSQWRPGTRTRVERIYFESQAYYFRKHYGRLMEWLLRAVRFPYLATSLRRRFLERHGVRIRVASDPA